jgi:flagellar motility protein MotE (MotC chaperone)
MNKKQIILIILILTIPTTILFLGVVGIYKYRPQWLGIPPSHAVTSISGNSNDTNYNSNEDSIIFDPIIQVKRSKFDSIFSKLIYYDINRNLQESLTNENYKLKDSIVNLSLLISSVQDSLSGKIIENLSTLQLLSKLGDSLAITKARLNYAVKNYSSEKEKKPKDQPIILQKKLETMYESNLREISQIFNNIEPNKAARILESTTVANASHILKAMDKKKAGKIIEVMKPKFGASILEFEFGN